jgi:hypothetical protein
VTLAASYIPSVVVAATSDHDGDKWLYAPVIGPWVDLATRGCTGDSRTPTCGVTGFERAALIGTGVVQVFGAAQIAGAFFLPQRHLTTKTASDKPTVQFAPATFGSSGQGIVALGTF